MEADHRTRLHTEYISSDRFTDRGPKDRAVSYTFQTDQVMEMPLDMALARR